MMSLVVKSCLIAALLALLSLGCSDAGDSGGNEKAAEPAALPADSTAQPSESTAQPSESSMIRGGPCGYDTYQGEARVVSVTPDPAQAGSAPVEVKILFAPSEPIGQEWVDLSREYSLLLDHIHAPTGDYVVANDLTPGKALPARMLVITKGTCTPVLFEYPELPQP